MGKKKFSSQADLKIAVIGDEVCHNVIFTIMRDSGYRGGLLPRRCRPERWHGDNEFPNS